MRLIDADALRKCFEVPHELKCGIQAEMDEYALKCIDEQPTIAASPWHRVEEPPKKPGEYIVAYHPCYWDNVNTKVTEVGIDNFRGKSAWAKKKHQRVTHWMDKPEPPKEDE